MKVCAATQNRLTNSATAVQNQAFTIKFDKGMGRSSPVRFSGRKGDCILVSASFTTDPSSGAYYWSIGYNELETVKKGRTRISETTNPVQAVQIPGGSFGTSTIARFEVEDEGEIEFFVSFLNKSPEGAVLATNLALCRGLVIHVQTIQNKEIADAILKRFGHSEGLLSPPSTEGSNATK